MSLGKVLPRKRQVTVKNAHGAKLPKKSIGKPTIDRERERDNRQRDRLRAVFSTWATLCCHRLKQTYADTKPHLCMDALHACTNHRNEHAAKLLQNSWKHRPVTPDHICASAHCMHAMRPFCTAYTVSRKHKHTRPHLSIDALHACDAADFYVYVWNQLHRQDRNMQAWSVTVSQKSVGCWYWDYFM